MTDSTGDNIVDLAVDQQDEVVGSDEQMINPTSEIDKTTLKKSDIDDRKKQLAVRQECPYLSTIDRKSLDFDFEKLCSVSLSKVNVYACLVCGKYFQGRGRSTHAFIHSVSDSHHVFLNLETLKFYCLPDNYEIEHESLSDILYVLKPTFKPDEIDRLDHQTKTVQAYDGKQYYPGIVGLNNLKYNDYCNVIFQALSHVIPLRNYFLVEQNYAPVKLNSGDDRYTLCQRFGELLRKLWNARNFKAHVSPHEMLQAIVLSSNKKFEFTRQSDPIVFMGWFLNAIIGPKRQKSSIIKLTFQGKIRIASRLLLADLSAAPTSAIDEPKLVPARDETFDVTSFLYLTFDLPTMPLFPKKDEKGKVIKPRVSIYELLGKFDGKTKHEHRGYKDAAIKRYEILELPKYLILYYKRFARNTFFTEKNTYLVDFPISKLEMAHLLAEDGAGGRRRRPKDGQPIGGAGDEHEQRRHDNSDEVQTMKQFNYSLVANIVHDGEPDSGKGTYRAHILHRPTGKWFEMQDLYVTELVDTTLITLSEPYIQIWELKE